MRKFHTWAKYYLKNTNKVKNYHKNHHIKKMERTKDERERIKYKKLSSILNRTHKKCKKSKIIIQKENIGMGHVENVKIIMATIIQSHIQKYERPKQKEDGNEIKQDCNMMKASESIEERL